MLSSVLEEHDEPPSSTWQAHKLVSRVCGGAACVSNTSRQRTSATVPDSMSRVYKSLRGLRPLKS